jgi:ParB family chromosome partitioning protein
MARNKQLALEDTELDLVPGGVKKAMAQVGASSSDLWKVSLDDLRIIPNFNVRIRDEKFNDHIRALADSMKAEGFYPDKPFAGYVAKEGDAQVIYITDGHCRYEAAKLAISEGAEISKVPVVVVSQGTSVEDLTVALVRANSGKPLEPYEMAIVCKRLARFGWDTPLIASRLGITTTYVENLLLLIAGPTNVRNMVMEGQVAAATAIDAMRRYGDQAFDKLQAALDTAKAAGGNRVTKKHMPEVIFKKAVAKAAPTLFESMREVTQDPGYRKLSPELRQKLDHLMAELNTNDLLEPKGE